MQKDARFVNLVLVVTSQTYGISYDDVRVSMVPLLRETPRITDRFKIDAMSITKIPPTLRLNR